MSTYTPVYTTRALMSKPIQVIINYKYATALLNVALLELSRKGDKTIIKSLWTSRWVHHALLSYINDIA